MPKATNTRKQRANALLERLQRGPGCTRAFLHMEPSEAKALESELTASYKLWIDTWIVDELKDLIPELRKS